jgi:predicted phosphate transport protein (TIGR00153 family)
LVGRDIRKGAAMVRIIPRETKFFDLFADVASNVTEGARLLTSLLEGFDNIEVRVDKLREIEHKGDDLTHAIMTKLNQTFITPFDREDIHRLASAMDDVLDYVNAAAQRLLLYKIRSAPGSAVELAKLIVRQSEELNKAVVLLEKTKGVMEHCVEINRLEDEADRVCREAIGKLFEHEKDAIQLIKMKELYEVLELATDKAEDAANVLEAVVLKSA